MAHLMRCAGARRDCAAVASSRAGELYGLQALDKSIQDDQDNFTCAGPLPFYFSCGSLTETRLPPSSRFIALSREPLPASSSAAGVTYKTSIVFSLAEGACYRVSTLL